MGPASGRPSSPRSGALCRVGSGGAAALPQWGSSLTPASCLSSRPRHIPVPLDPHCGRTASFGASRTALRSLGGTAWAPAPATGTAGSTGGRPPMIRRLDGVGTASHSPGSYDRSQDPDDREGRRTLGPCPKWHMDVPRPFVKTGRRPEGWDMGPGCGGPVRSRRFNRGKRPHGEPRLQQGTATPSGTDVSTGYDRPCKAPAPCAADQRPLPERK